MEWEKFLRLRDDTVARLRAAEGDNEGVEAALRQYIAGGERLGASPYDLWDFFAISHPGIPARAGYRGRECDQIGDVFHRLMKDRYGA